MAFQIEQITSQGVERMLSAERAHEIRRASGMSVATFHGLVGRDSWAVDHERQAFFLLIPMNKEEALWRYLFVLPAGALRLEKRGYCRYSIEYASPEIAVVRDLAESLVKEAFSVSGELLNGATDPNDDTAVLDAEVTWNSTGLGT